MVDFNLFFEYVPPNSPILGELLSFTDLDYLSAEICTNPKYQKIYRPDRDGYPPTNSIASDQSLHYPPRVLYYALKQKKWAQLLVDKLTVPDKADATVFQDKLQLDEESKEPVDYSVTAHQKGKGMKGESHSLQNFAPGKGKGLVIMLYGYPGVGKTLMVESVALMAGKPLLSVEVSDIGITGAMLEATLQKVFDLAGKWEAVLLFDEADVFLEARGTGEHDLQRNAMVLGKML